MSATEISTLLPARSRTSSCACSSAARTAVAPGTAGRRAVALVISAMAVVEGQGVMVDECPRGRVNGVRPGPDLPC